MLVSFFGSAARAIGVRATSTNEARRALPVPSLEHSDYAEILQCDLASSTKLGP